MAIAGALTACGSTSQPGETAAPATPESKAAVSPTAGLPTPEPSADPRSPQSLAEQFTFEAPPQDDPNIAAAIEGFASFGRQFVIAEGLGDPDYPPLLARIDSSDPAFKDAILSNLRINKQAEEYLLGRFSDRVTGAAGDAISVLIDTCTDYTDRLIYSKVTNKALGGLPVDVVRGRVTMIRNPTGWVISQYSVPKEQNCA